jgi:head-tail adaptor
MALRVVRSIERDRLITIERKTVTLSDTGDEVATWAPIVQRWWARVRPVIGGIAERFGDAQTIAIEQVHFNIPYAEAVADVAPQDRVIYPLANSAAEQQPPGNREIYDIAAVHEIGRRQELLLVTIRRRDAQ